jgi:peroxiredoxin
MRIFPVVPLACLLATGAGCGSSPSTATPAPAPAHSQAELTETANKFRDTVKSDRTHPGENLPLKFLDTGGAEVDLASFRGKSHVVLVVVMGFPKNWGGKFCVGCLAQLNSLTANYADFKKRDAEVLMVFPGPTDRLPQFLTDSRADGADGNPKVPFPILSDTDLKAVKALGIEKDWARPATYILNKKGDVVFTYVSAYGGAPGTASSEGIYDRPSVKAMFAQLDKLNAKE